MVDFEVKGEINALIKLQTRSRNVNRELIATAGYDLVTIYVLYRINESHSSQLIKELATELNISSPTVSTRLSHLMKVGLITAVPTVEDRRHEQLLLTKKGRAHLAKFGAIIHQVYINA